MDNFTPSLVGILGEGGEGLMADFLFVFGYESPEEMKQPSGSFIGTIVGIV